MKRTRLLIAVGALTAFACGLSHAANIVWVSDNPNTNSAGAVTNVFSGPINGTPDDSFVTMLQAAGHNVIRFSSADSQNSLLSQEDIDALNTNDLIIIGRSLTSGAFQAPQGHQWNTNIVKPLICQNAYLARNSRLGWFSGSDDVPDGVPAALTIANFTDPTNAYLFGGIPLNGARMINNYDIAFGRNTSHINPTNPPVAGGRILATFGTTNVMVDFQAGTVVKGGANVLGGYRLYFACGNREPNGGAISTTAGTNNLSADGQNIFLRAVTLALNNGVPPNLGEVPTFTLQPADANGCAGSSITLTSFATGENPIYYQWYFSDGATFTNAVTDATNASYTIANLQPANVGYYAVLATNVNGSATSSVAAVTIVGTATVATGPDNQTNCPGTAVTFTTSATGSGTLTYTWRKNGNIVQGPDLNNSYSIASVAVSDAGTYTVEVSGQCNNVTNSATLVVADVPAITAQPQDQATPMGNGAVFSVTASTLATQPTTYQWQTNGVDVTGANGSTFAISNLTLAANGMQVRVQVANCAGNQYSSAATLTVTPVSGISFDFDTPGQYTNAPYYLTYNNWINSGFLPLSPNVVVPTMFESPIGGVGAYPGSGALELAPNQGADSSSVLLPVSFDFSLPGKTVVASTMFKVKTPITAGRRATQLALVTQTNYGVVDTTPQAFTSVIVQDPTAGNPTYELHTQRRNSTGGLQESVVTGQAGLTVSNWYKLTATFVNTASPGNPNFSISATLQDMGPLGTTPGAVALSFTTTTNNCDIVQFRNVYLAIRSFEDGGVETRDNTYAYTTPGNIFFVQEPQAQTVTQGDRTQFRAYVDGEGPYTYIWQRDDGASGFTNIPLAGSWNYIIPPARISDNGALFRVVVNGPANSITSSPVALTVTAEALAVVGVGSVDGTTVGVEFNQPVDVASAENPANYTINGTSPKHARVYRTSLGALGPEGIYVVLTPAAPLSGGFNVVVSGVTDLSGGAISGANSGASAVAGLTGYDVNPVTGPPGEQYAFGPTKIIVSGGGSDIFSGGDGFHYVYGQVTGDFDYTFKIPYMDTVRFTAKAGMDARLSLDPFSPGVFAGFDPGPIGEQASAIRQFTEGTAKLGWGFGGTSWGNNIRLSHPNVWIRFRRAGNNFMRYSSADGVNWTFDGQIQPFTAFDDQPTVYLGLAVCSAHNLFRMSAEFDNVAPFAGYPGSTIAISSQPTNFTVAAGSSFTDGLVATLTGGGAPARAGELAYVWQRSNTVAGGWVNLPNAGMTNNTIGIGPLYSADNGAKFRVLVQAPGATTVTSAVFTATVTDTAAPTISAVNATIPNYEINDVVINLNEPISEATATDISHYSVTNADGVVLTVISAGFLNGDPRTIVVKVDGSLGLGTGSVGISGLRDLNNNLLATAVRTFRSFATPFGAVGPVVVEYYQDIGTTANITALTANAMFTAGQPSWISYSNLLGANVNFGGSTFPGITFSAGTVAEDNYGIKAYTYFIAPSNGQYKFWIRGDDFAQLFMNTNSTDSTNPAGKVLLAELTANSANYSVGTTPANSQTNITLVAGQAYYMEFLFKETGGGDGGSVMWTAPNVTTAPTATTFIPTANLAYPDAVAPKTPVVAEYYVGYTPALTANGGVATLTSATNAPTGLTNYVVNNNVEQAANFKYLAGLPDHFAAQKYFAAQPQLANTRLDNYMGRIISYFVPPTNGNYKFYMRSDDASQLYMNTNAVNSTDASGKKLLGKLDAYTSAYTLVAQNVSLVGGQKYYMEALWREGGGGDGVAVAVRAQGDSAVPPIGPPPETIPASMLAYPFEYGRSGDVDFAGILPGIAAEGQSLTLIPYGVHGAPIPGGGVGNDAQRNMYGYMWYKNGVRVLDSSFTNVTPPLTLADNGAVYKLVITNLYSSAERSITLTVVPDTTAPVITRAVGWRTGDGFTLKFNERVDKSSATYLGNYMVAGLQLIDAVLDPSGTMLSIRTSQQAPNTTYTVMVTGVKDASSAGNAVTTNVTFSTWGIGGSGILVELFTNIVGATIGDLVGAPKFAANLPDVVYYTNTFSVGAFGANTGLENYGARVTALFVPTNTGYYRFYTRQDDAAMLFMNINSVNSEDPNGKTMILHSQGANISLQDPRSISTPIFLNAGQRYYTEALMKEGTGGDYMLITFRATDSDGAIVGNVPADAATELIGSANFGGAPGNPDDFQFNIVSTPPTEVFVNENDLLDLKLVAKVTPPSITPYVSYQWARSNANSGVFTDIPGATSASLATLPPYFATLADDGAAYRLIASLPGTTLKYETLVHVAVDTVAPALVSASSVDPYVIGLRFSEPIDLGIGGETGTYDITDSDGVTHMILTAAIVRTNIDPRTVQLTLLDPISGTNFHVDVFGMADRATTQNFGDSSVDGDVQPLRPLDIGTAGLIAAGGYNALLPGSTFTATNGEYDVSANGWDIWNTADGFHYTYQPVSGNFDVKVRVDRFVGADTWSKAGLMVRVSTNSNSRMFFIGLTPETTPIVGQNPNNLFASQYRDADGGPPANVQNTVPPGYPNAWVRLQRSNSVFYGFFSTNGTDWSLLNSRDTAITTGGAYPDTALVGLATVSHDQTRGLANNAFVQYRDLHFPMGAAIMTQPGPSLVVTGIHNNVTFSGLVASGAGLQYQWRKDGVAIPGANNANLTILNASVADSGLYSVSVFNDGGGQISSDLQLIVTNALPVVGNDSLQTTQGVIVTFPATDLLSNDSDPEGDALSVIAVSGVYPVTYSANFDDGQVPAGDAVFGAVGTGASVKPDGGVDNSGHLEINPAVNSASGSFVIHELTPGKRVSAFTASFKLKVYNGSGEPADGFSFNFGNDLPDSATTAYAAEQGGTATGLSFCVDNYRFAPLAVGAPANAPGGGTANTSGLKINYKNTIIAGVQINAGLTPSAWNVDRYVPVSITVLEDGTCTVLIDGTNVFGTIVLPNYTPSKGRFGIYGRTGGQNQAVEMDDINITVRTIDTVNESHIAGGSLYGVAYTSDGALHLTDAINGQIGAFVLDELTPGTAVNSFTASFSLRIGNGSGNAADGMSFNFANDLPLTAGAAEEGAGTGLSICVDNYPTGGADAPSFKLKYAGALITPPILIPKWSNPNFIPVNVTLAADGALTLTVDGTNVVTGLATGFVPTTGRFGLYARTGGENETHWVDDLNISVNGGATTYANNFDAQFGPGTVVLTNGIVVYTPPPNGCGSDAFYYITSDGQLNGTSIGQVNVTVNETNPVAPVILLCATNRTIVLADTNQTALPSMVGEVIASDTCGTPVITQNPPAGTTIGVGTTLVDLIATDYSGLSATCQVQVVVQAAAAPMFTAGSAHYDGVAGTFSATLPTVNGVTYVVEYKDDLNAPDWTMLTTINGDGTVQPFTDPGPLPATRFYRIRTQ